MTRWADLAGADSGAAYAARIAAQAGSGLDMHGEASFCAALAPPGARVLDAGCGTGRVLLRLAELGYDCVGVDADASMLAVARTPAPDAAWVLADLAALPDLGTFDLVVAAGNVIPLLAAGSEPGVTAGLAGALRPGGALVAGFGLVPEQLPLPEATITLADYDAWCAAAGLVLETRVAGWDAAPYEGGGYAVSVHRTAAGDDTGTRRTTRRSVAGHAAAVRERRAPGR